MTSCPAPRRSLALACVAAGAGVVRRRRRSGRRADDARQRHPPRAARSSARCRSSRSTASSTAARGRPARWAGLANLTGSLLSEGTKGPHVGGDLALIDSLGGSFDTTGTSSGLVLASAAVLSRDFATGVDLIARSLRADVPARRGGAPPQGDPSASSEADEDEPGVVAQRAFHARRCSATPHTARRWTARLRASRSSRATTWSRTTATRSSPTAICAIVGDVPTSEDMKATVERRSATGRAAASRSPRRPRPRRPRSRSVVDRPVTQASVILGQIGTSARTPTTSRSR